MTNRDILDPHRSTRHEAPQRARPGPSVIFCIGEEQSWAGVRNDAAITEPLRLELGDRRLVRTTFGGNFPNERILELAIAVIEEAVIRTSIPPGSTIGLCNSSSLHVVREWLGWPLRKTVLTPGDVEAAFSRIVRGVQGQPIDRPDGPSASETVAYITILREAVHHWAVATVELNDADALPCSPHAQLR